MAIKSKSKKNKFAKELFSSKFRSKILNQKKVKVVLLEKILKHSAYLLDNFRRHFSSFV